MILAKPSCIQIIFLLTCILFDEHGVRGKQRPIIGSWPTDYSILLRTFGKPAICQIPVHKPFTIRNVKAKNPRMTISALATFPAWAEPSDHPSRFPHSLVGSMTLALCTVRL